MIHHHLTTALKASLDYYLEPANEQSWLDHLYNPSHDDQLLLKALSELRADPPKVIPHATAGVQGLPLIVCQQLNRSVIHRPLGGSALGLEQTISTQSAQVEIMATGSELTEILAQTVVTALHALRKEFISNGYLTFQFDQIAELAPQEQLAAGERLVEMLKQRQYSPIRVGMQVVQLYAGTRNITGGNKTWIRDYPASDIQRYCRELEEFTLSKHPEVVEQIETVGDLKEPVVVAIENLLAEFAKVFTPSAS